MDIVYIVGKPSANGDIELRWSLRSIAQHGKNVGRVIVTSPVERDWLSGDVETFYCPDLPFAGYKHINITNAILHTAKKMNLDGEFLVSSDDHFYLKDVDFDHYPFYVRDWKVEMKPKGSTSVQTMIWRTSVKETGEYLRANNLPCVNFQGHMNSHWNGGLIEEFKEHFDKAQHSRFGFEPHLLMANLWLSKDPTLPLVYREDKKLFKFDGIDERLECISCGDEVMRFPAFVEFMNAEFGEKCRYER